MEKRAPYVVADDQRAGPPADPVEVYSRNGITLWHGQNERWLPLQPINGYDLIVTSPPFNLGRDTGGLRRTESGTPTGKTNAWRNGSGTVYGDFDDDLPEEVYAAQQTRLIADCWGTLTEEGALFYHHKPRIREGEVLLPTDFFKAAGVPIRQIITWDRMGGHNFNPHYYTPGYEWLIVAARSRWRLRRGREGAGRTDLWRILPERSNPHPAPFPLALVRRILHSIATPIRRVMDPYLGSGTVAVACAEVGVEFHGIERNRVHPFLDYAIERVEQTTRTSTLLAPRQESFSLEEGHDDA